MGVMTLETSTLTQLEPAAKGLAGIIVAETSDGVALEDVLFEQLDYLLQFAEQERDRLERVKAILMEPFH